LISSFNEDSGACSLPLGELNDLSPLTLVRAALAFGPGLVVSLALFRRSLAAGLAVRVFLVFLLRQRGRDAPVTEISDSNPVFVLTAPDGQTITAFQCAAGFDPVPVQLNLTAFYSFTRQCTGFEKPRRPQPFINPD